MTPGFKPFTGSNIVALRFGDHGTKEMLRAVCLKVQPVSDFNQQARNNMQLETDAICMKHQRLFVRVFKSSITGNSEELH